LCAPLARDPPLSWCNVSTVVATLYHGKYLQLEETGKIVCSNEGQLGVTFFFNYKSLTFNNLPIFLFQFFVHIFKMVAFFSKSTLIIDLHFCKNARAKEDTIFQATFLVNLLTK